MAYICFYTEDNLNALKFSSYLAKSKDIYLKQSVFFLKNLMSWEKIHKKLMGRDWLLCKDTKTCRQLRGKTSSHRKIFSAGR